MPADLPAGVALDVRVRAFDHPDVTAMIESIQQLYLHMYGDRDQDSTDPAEFAPPRGLFLLGYLGDADAGGVAVASGGWRRRDDTTAEIKRMFVAEQARGRGIARTVLAVLEDTALQAGVTRMVLNTGFRQVDAISLYESAGYARTDERFGHYAGFPGAHFFAKHLTPDST